MLNPDRQNRCQGVGSNGQCPKDAQPGSSFCIIHNGGKDLAKRQDFRLYYFLKAEDRSRLTELTQHDACRSLRGEVAIIRMLIERQINLRTDRPDLLAAYGTLNSLLLTSKDLTESLYTLEQNLDTLLAKPTLLAFGSEFITILIEELKNIPDCDAIIERISGQIILAVGNAGLENPSNCLKTVVENSGHLYRFQNSDYQRRLLALCEHNDAKHLREEIAIARMLLEERLNLIQTDSDFLAACGTLNSQLLTISKLVQSAHKLEQKLGSLLTKSTLLLISNKFVNILISELKGLTNYETLIDSISSKLFSSLSQI